jgi:hypothetical protein
MAKFGRDFARGLSLSRPERIGPNIMTALLLQRRQRDREEKSKLAVADLNATLADPEGHTPITTDGVRLKAQLLRQAEQDRVSTAREQAKVQEDLLKEQTKRDERVVSTLADTSRDFQTRMEKLRGNQELMRRGAEVSKRQRAVFLENLRALPNGESVIAASKALKQREGFAQEQISPSVTDAEELAVVTQALRNTEAQLTNELGPELEEDADFFLASTRSLSNAYEGIQRRAASIRGGGDLGLGFGKDPEVALAELDKTTPNITFRPFTGGKDVPQEAFIRFAKRRNPELLPKDVIESSQRDPRVGRVLSQHGVNVKQLTRQKAKRKLRAAGGEIPTREPQALGPPAPGQPAEEPVPEEVGAAAPAPGEDVILDVDPQVFDFFFDPNDPGGSLSFMGKTFGGAEGSRPPAEPDTRGGLEEAMIASGGVQGAPQPQPFDQPIGPQPIRQPRPQFGPPALDAAALGGQEDFLRQLGQPQLGPITQPPVPRQGVTTARTPTGGTLTLPSGATFQTPQRAQQQFEQQPTTMEEFLGTQTGGGIPDIPEVDLASGGLGQMFPGQNIISQQPSQRPFGLGRPIQQLQERFQGSRTLEEFLFGLQASQGFRRAMEDRLGGQLSELGSEDNETLIRDATANAIRSRFADAEGYQGRSGKPPGSGTKPGTTRGRKEVPDHGGPGKPVPVEAG